MQTNNSSEGVRRILFSCGAVWVLFARCFGWYAFTNVYGNRSGTVHANRESKEKERKKIIGIYDP